VTWTDLPAILGTGAVGGALWLLSRLLHRYSHTPRQCHVCLAFRHRRDRALRGGNICICCAQQQRCARRAGLDARYWQTVRACQEACLRGPALWRRVGMELFLTATEPTRPERQEVEHAAH
jgi:hypothetical protein